MKRIIIAFVVISIMVLISGNMKSEPKQVIVVANSIDESPELIEYLEKYGLTYNIDSISAEEFEEKKDIYKYFIILGGPDAPEGIGEIVQQILPLDKQEEIRKSDEPKIFYHEIDEKTYVVLAGHDRECTKEAVKGLKHGIFNYIPRDPINWGEKLGNEDIKVTAVDIADLNNNSFYEFVLGYTAPYGENINNTANSKIGIIVVENQEIIVNHYLSRVIKINFIKVYDLDKDGQKEIIAACDVLPDENEEGYVYVYNMRENSAELDLKWSKSVPGEANLLYCYDNKVAVFSYKEEGQPGQGKITIFDQEGTKIKSFEAGGDISKFEIRDIDNDGRKEVILAGIHDAGGGHSLRVLDLEGNEIWKYEADHWVWDFQCYNGTQEVIAVMAVHTHLVCPGFLIGDKEGELLWKSVELHPPIICVEIIDNKIITANNKYVYLFEFGEEKPYSMLARRRQGESIVAEYLFLVDIDNDGLEEIILGDGSTLEIYELEEFYIEEDSTD